MTMLPLVEMQLKYIVYLTSRRRDFAKEIKDIHNTIKYRKKMVYTDSDRVLFSQAETCHVCDRGLEGDKVRDHCHITGKFRGAAHNRYNLRFQLPKFTPIFFHNLAGYDSHLFIKNLGVSEDDLRSTSASPSSSK
jgi:transposase